jgi:peptidase C13-like protein
MRNGKGLIYLVLAVALWAWPAQAAGYADWGAVVVAGDYRAHSGADSEVFDNARRDLAADLMRIGFLPSNVVQFSVRPERYATQAPRPSDPNTIATTLWDVSNRTSGGCLVFFTSHGSTDGVVVGDETLSPKRMKEMVGNACGDSPTVVIVSACFSGVFVPALAGPNRLVLTAARPDRTSFGCGEQFKYTYFDECLLENFVGAGDFVTLAKEAIACVAAKEKKGKIFPSEPQLSIGEKVEAALPHWK